MSTDRDHLKALLAALAGTEEELIAAIGAAAAHLEANPIEGMEVQDSTMGEWLDSGGERRKTER